MLNCLSDAKFYEKFVISIEMWTAVRKSCEGLKQQDGQVQSRSFNFVVKTCRVSTSLNKCLVQIDSFYHFSSCFYLFRLYFLLSYGSNLSFKDGTIFWGRF